MGGVVFRCLLGSVSGVWIVLGTGCSVADPVTEWQSAVERYVADVGNGDPTVLRHVAGSAATQVDRRGLITFHRLALPAPRWSHGQTLDVFGALLEVRLVQNGRAYVFAIAVAERAPPTSTMPVPAVEIRDVRVAVLHTPPRNWKWRVSPTLPEATERYRAGRTASDAFARPFFPAPGDRFESAWADGCLTVVERRSGARWDLPLSEHAPASRPE